jgi:predicted aspartyl protease
VATGVVTAAGMAVIPLQLQDTIGQEETLPAIVDTGFNGFLTLPLSQIAKLGFHYEGNIEVMLGDEREVKGRCLSGHGRIGGAGPGRHHLGSGRQSSRGHGLAERLARVP